METKNLIDVPTFVPYAYLNSIDGMYKVDKWLATLPLRQLMITSSHMAE